MEEPNKQKAMFPTDWSVIIRSRKWILTIIEGSPKRPLKTKACELKKKKADQL